MDTTLQPADLATFFASLDRRLDERPTPNEGEIDEPRRAIELMLADLDKRLVVLGCGEGDLDQALGHRVAARLRELDDDDWDKPASISDTGTSLLDHVRSVVGDTAAELRR